jgi:hypothetical protein
VKENTMLSSQGKQTTILVGRTDHLRAWWRMQDPYTVGGVALLLLIILVSGARQALAHVSIGWRSSAPIIIVATARPDVGLLGTKSRGGPVPTPALPTPEVAADAERGAALALPTQSPAGAAPETAPARDYAAEAQQAINASVPPGAVLVQDPGGSYLQAPGSAVKYDIDGAGNVVNVRLPGADVAPQAAPLDSSQKTFLDPADPADAAAIAAAAAAQQLVPTVAQPCAARAGCRR